MSNNDGCVIARSQEVKDLGIPMGIPIFKIRHLVEIHDIQIFSSNFSLYGDISNRIMSIIRSDNADIEVYSIDEAFVNINPRFLLNMLQNLEIESINGLEYRYQLE